MPQNKSGNGTRADRMTRAQAIALLGGTQGAAARRIGVSQQAVSQWPRVLSPKLRDRVQAALWREANDYALWLEAERRELAHDLRQLGVAALRARQAARGVAL